MLMKSHGWQILHSETFLLAFFRTTRVTRPASTHHHWLLGELVRCRAWLAGSFPTPLVVDEDRAGRDAAVGEAVAVQEVARTVRVHLPKNVRAHRRASERARERGAKKDSREMERCSDERDKKSERDRGRGRER